MLRRCGIRHVDPAVSELMPDWGIPCLTEVRSFVTASLLNTHGHEGCPGRQAHPLYNCVSMLWSVGQSWRPDRRQKVLFREASAPRAAKTRRARSYSFSTMSCILLAVECRYREVVARLTCCTHGTP